MGAIGVKFPNNISGLTSWYDAYNLGAVYNVGDNVDTFKDVLGNNDLAVTRSGGDTNGKYGLVGTKPGVSTFCLSGGVGTYYRKDNVTSFNGLSVMTCYCVGSSSDLSTATVVLGLIVQNTTGAGTLLFQQNLSGNTSLTQRRVRTSQPSDVGGGLVNQGSCADNTPYLSSSILNFPTYHRTRSRETEQYISTVTSSLTFTNTVRIAFSDSAAGGVIGYIHEALIFNRALTTLEDAEVRYYLQKKWGL